MAINRLRWRSLLFPVRRLHNANVRGLYILWHVRVHGLSLSLDSHLDCHSTRTGYGVTLGQCSSLPPPPTPPPNYSDEKRTVNPTTKKTKGMTYSGSKTNTLITKAKQKHGLPLPLSSIQMRKETNTRSWIRSRRTEATQQSSAREGARAGGQGKQWDVVGLGRKDVGGEASIWTGALAQDRLATPHPSRPVTPAPFLGPATNS
jgi:hypothetical protein